MYFGDWEGHTYDHIQARWPDEWTTWHTDMMAAAPPGGETTAQAAVRVGAALDDIVRAADGRTVVVVAHGGTLRVLLHLAIGLGSEVLWRIRMDPASLSELSYRDGRARLTYLNDTHHLEGQDA
jgi:broad specificity phosphatase PhoE